ncbi:helix-turn-helix domain-containing protein [Nitrospirales bacterium NOB]|nr:helix-turn-helix domain-containing protein [Nitrospirales bacterium NOB]
MPKTAAKRRAGPAESVMTIDELSSYLKVPKSTLYKLAQERRVPGQKVGRHWRFHKEAVDSWLKNQRQDR